MMGEVVVVVVCVVGYVGVGIVEFIMMGDVFYFMEMNMCL